MRHLILIFVLCIVFWAPAFSQGTPLSKGELKAIAERGKYLAECDDMSQTAVWALQWAGFDQDGLLVIPRKVSRRWTVVFGRLNDQQDQFLIHYEATEPGPHFSRFKISKHAPPLPDTGFNLAAARAMAQAMAKHNSQVHRYQMIPTSNRSGGITVYGFLGPTFTRRLGADFQEEFSADGLVLLSGRELHQTLSLANQPAYKSIPDGEMYCYDYTFSGELRHTCDMISSTSSHEERIKVSLTITALHDVPEDTDVAFALRSGYSVFVMATNGYYFVNPNGQIQYQRAK